MDLGEWHSHWPNIWCHISLRKRIGPCPLPWKGIFHGLISLACLPMTPRECSYRQMLCIMDTLSCFPTFPFVQETLIRSNNWIFFLNSLLYQTLSDRCSVWRAEIAVSIYPYPSICPCIYLCFLNIYYSLNQMWDLRRWICF